MNSVKHDAESCVPGDPERLAIVYSLYGGEFCCVPLHQVSELVEQTGPFNAGDILAPSRAERFAGCGHCEINILRGA